MEAIPWPSNQLKRLGASIRDAQPAPEGVPGYDEVELWYAGLAARVQRRLLEHDWRPVLGRREFEVSARAKTIDTLRDKLRRDRSTPLSSVQDIAGVRFEAEMTLGQQTRVARTIAEVFGQDPERAIHDLRDAPHSGYRAVHVWLRLPARVEVQVRTHLQSAWANAYEALADVAGREIRYGVFPDDPGFRSLVEMLQETGVQTVAGIEIVTNVFSTFKDEEMERQGESVRASGREFADALRRIEESMRTLSMQKGGES